MKNPERNVFVFKNWRGSQCINGINKELLSLFFYCGRKIIQKLQKPHAQLQIKVVTKLMCVLLRDFFSHDKMFIAGMIYALDTNKMKNICTEYSPVCAEIDRLSISFILIANLIIFVWNFVSISECLLYVKFFTQFCTPTSFDIKWLLLSPLLFSYSWFSPLWTAPWLTIKRLSVLLINYEVIFLYQ